MRICVAKLGAASCTYGAGHMQKGVCLQMQNIHLPWLTFIIKTYIMVIGQNLIYLTLEFKRYYTLL